MVALHCHAIITICTGRTPVADIGVVAGGLKFGPIANGETTENDAWNFTDVLNSV